MEKIIPFKNIRVSDNIDSLANNDVLPAGTVIVIMCKQGRLRVEATPQKGYEMHEHDLLLCMPDFLMGNYMYTPDFRCLLFCIRQETINDVVYSCLRVENNWYDKLRHVRQHPIIHMNERQIALYDAYEQLIDLHIRNINPYQDRISDALAQAIIFEILAMVEDSMPRVTNYKGHMPQDLVINKSRLNQLFYRFMQLLEANHNSRYSVCWYANEMAITPKYLTYICKQVTGKTPTDIINSIAIREIKQVLLNTNDTIKEIAYSMNYSSASSFCKYFRLQTGISPQAFRRQNHRQHPQP